MQALADTLDKQKLHGARQEALLAVANEDKKLLEAALTDEAKSKRHCAWIKVRH